MQKQQIYRNLNSLQDFGFNHKKGGTHTSRTIMLGELEGLLSYVHDFDALKADYYRAIVEENCLRKPSAKTRLLTFRHLVELYLLDSSYLLFRALIFFWQRDELARPLLALLCAYSRDNLLRSTASMVLRYERDKVLPAALLAQYIEQQEPGRFSPVTLASTTRNLLSTWTKSGHLLGKSGKQRSRVIATPGAVAYALLLGYLTNHRGKNLFATEYMNLLDCSTEQAIELAEEASRRGWIVFKRVETVMEVLFPNLLNLKEQEWIREQG